jgi:phage tail sheath protein FI
MPPPKPPENLPKFVVPGVYIEEIQLRTRPIAGVQTSITAFVGLALEGPANQVSGPLASYADFKALYGDAPLITFADQTQVRNYLAVAAQAFFENGGMQLYISLVTAADGSNSAQPVADDYVRALKLLESIAEIAVVAAPGAAVANASGIAAVAPVHAALIAHAERQGAYRFAVLDPPQGCSVVDVRSLRGQLDSKSAALYYPWVSVLDPSAAAEPGAQISLPPSGFLCGIYAQNDTAHGVFKAPANIAIQGATGFETTINDQTNAALNPLGINCLRSFPVYGRVLWGSRTLRGADAFADEYKYIPVRRTALYIEESLYRGLKWVVFEPNDEPLWSQVRLNVGAFMHNLFRQGAFQGRSPREAYFVKCDSESTTQNDINLGIVNIIVGFAPLKPAEFVVIKLQQITGQIEV